MKITQKSMTGGMSRTRIARFQLVSFPEAAAAALHMAHWAKARDERSASERIAHAATENCFKMRFISRQCPSSTAVVLPPVNL